MALKLLYITNDPEVALIAEKYGVGRIWIDLETLGKEERQKGMNTVKSKHSIEDIKIIKPLLSSSEMLVRVNPWNAGSTQEINSVIDAGADIIMLPYWKTVDEVQLFVDAVGGRCKTTLLLETKESVEVVDEVLMIPGIDEIHIGINDLHLSYGMTFMFELLSNGMVEKLCHKFREAGIPYGFGGIAKFGEGLIPAEKIIMEHYRLGSTRAILSRTFCNKDIMSNIEKVDSIFRENLRKLRAYEEKMINMSIDDFDRNRCDVIENVNAVVRKLQRN